MTLMMSTISEGELLRELARRHVRAQRAAVQAAAGCGASECALLGELGRRGPLGLRELALRLGLDKGFASRAVARLEVQGLVEKAAAATDRRRVALSLTARGRRRFEAVDRALREQAGRVFARVPARERAAARRTLARLCDALGAEPGALP